MLITMLAGVVGTGIGGIIGVCVGSSNRRWIGVMLSLASGVTSMISKKQSTSDGFGILGIASMGPILLVLLMGVLTK